VDWDNPDVRAEYMRAYYEQRTIRSLPDAVLIDLRLTLLLFKRWRRSQKSPPT